MRPEAAWRTGSVVALLGLLTACGSMRGEVTRAGSVVLPRNSEPAGADAPTVARLRAAGAVIVAKTNMTELAFSGVGANPHFATTRAFRSSPL